MTDQPTIKLTDQQTDRHEGSEGWQTLITGSVKKEEAEEKKEEKALQEEEGGKQEIKEGADRQTGLRACLLVDLVILMLCF